MKSIVELMLIIIIMAMTNTACNKTAELNALQNEPDITSQTENIQKEDNMMNITVTVGESVFSAKLYDNDTANAFFAQLPLTLDMSELNGNEKYYYLADSLPSDSQKVGNINAGDLMLYGSDCLVLFYESFSTSYSYTKLGFIEDVSGLAAALGSGSVQVAFLCN